MLASFKAVIKPGAEHDVPEEDFAGRKNSAKGERRRAIKNSLLSWGSCPEFKLTIPCYKKRSKS